MLEATGGGRQRMRREIAGRALQGVRRRPDAVQIGSFDCIDHLCEPARTLLDEQIDDRPYQFLVAAQAFAQFIPVNHGVNSDGYHLTNELSKTTATRITAKMA